MLAATADRRESVALQEEALRLARGLGNAFEVATSASNLAPYHLLVADGPGAYRAGHEALAAMSEMGVAHVDRLMCASVFAYAAAHLGRFDEALAAASPLLAEGGPASANPVLHNLRNVLCTLALWRGRPDEAQALVPPDAPDDGPLSVRLTSLLTRLRWLAWVDTVRAARDRAQQRLLALGEQHPALRDDPHFYRGMALFEPAEQALSQLTRLIERETPHGPSPMLRSLHVTALLIQQPLDAAAALPTARLLLGSLHLGMHPTIYPPQAWWAVAQVLQAAGDAAGARKACLQARQWIDSARLWPAEDAPAASQARACFLRDNPYNRQIQAATG